MKTFLPSYRQVHLDFHTAPDVPNVGIHFNAEKFAETFSSAHVTSVTVFARCHHGNLYYNSKKFPNHVHPNLTHKNLLEQQIDALHSKGIRVPVYTTVQWDYLSFTTHPEWRIVNPSGSSVGWSPLQAGFYGFLCLNSAYRQYLKDHVIDLLECAPQLDGLFFDIVWRHECVCENCLRRMKSAGLNPQKQEDRYKMAGITIQDFTNEMSQLVRSLKSDASIYYNSADIGPGFREHLKDFSHLEFDILPAQHPDGYIQFPMRSRYERNLSHCVGQTGKFHGCWGDMGTLKEATALDYECAQLLSLNCRVMTGDQLPPDGQPDSSTYKLIGESYLKIKEREKWCTNAIPLTDIAILTMGGIDLGRTLKAATRLLQELGHQFEIIDEEMSFEGYRVLILPDYIAMNDTLHQRIQNYLQQGGKVLATFESGFNQEGTELVLTELGITLQSLGINDENGKRIRGVVDKGDNANQQNYPYTDYIRYDKEFAAEIPRTDFHMYATGTDVAANEGSIVWADLVRPIYYRTAEHFYSHRQAPPQNIATGAAIVATASTVYCAFPLFHIFQREGAWWMKRTLQAMLDILLPEPIFRLKAHPSVTATVNRQMELKRTIIHLCNYIPEKKCDLRQSIERPIPLFQIECSLRAQEEKVKSVKIVPDNREIPFYGIENRTEFVIPELCGHLMIEIETD